MLQVDKDHRDIVHNSTSLLSDPAIPSVLGQLIRRVHGLSWGLLADQVDGFLRRDKLPHAVAAEEKDVVLRGQLALSDFRLCRAASVRMPHEVAKAA